MLIISSVSFAFFRKHGVGQLALIAAELLEMNIFLSHSLAKGVVKLMLAVELHKGKIEFIAQRVYLKQKVPVRNAMYALYVILQAVPKRACLPSHLLTVIGSGLSLSSISPFGRMLILFAIYGKRPNAVCAAAFSALPFTLSRITILMRKLYAMNLPAS